MKKSKFTTLKLRVKSTPKNFTVNKFIIKISAISADSNVLAQWISPVFSITKLRLINQNSEIPHVWFKDEGGRDNCIEVLLKLVDELEHVVCDRHLPLKIQLQYFDGTLVNRQDILKVSPESNLSIGDKGLALIRFRIDDVSKNHQKQLFCIKVLPDTTTTQNIDIGAYISTPIEIRSKRSKRQRVKTNFNYNNNISNNNNSNSQSYSDEMNGLEGLPITNHTMLHGKLFMV